MEQNLDSLILDYLNLDSLSTDVEFPHDLKFLVKPYSAHVRDLAVLSGNQLERILMEFDEFHATKYLLQRRQKFGIDGVVTLDYCNEFLMLCQELFIRGRIPLHLAIILGDCSKIRELKEVFDDLTVKDQEGYTPLHFACFGGHKIEALALIERTSIDISMTDNTSLDIPFHTKVLRLESGRTCLISFGQNNEGNTPLHLACVHSHQEDLIMELVECEYSSIFTKNSDNKFPLQVAQRYHNVEYFSILLKTNYIVDYINDNSQVTQPPKHSMSRSVVIEDYLQICRTMLHDPLNIDSELYFFYNAMFEEIYKNENGLLPIETWFLHLVNDHVCWYYSLPRYINSEQANQMLTICSKDIEVRNYTYQVPYTKATVREIDEMLHKCSDNVKIVHCMTSTDGEQCTLFKYGLIRCGVNTKNKEGRTPFDAACVKEHFTACAWLMVREQCCVYLNVCKTDAQRCRAIQQICARTLSSFPKHSVINCIVPGDTLLHVAASMDNAAELLHYLTNVMKFDVTKVNSRQEYPLHIACRANHSAEVIKLFMSCDLHHRNIEGDSPLVLLFIHHHYELACQTASILHQDFMTVFLSDIHVKEWGKYNEKRKYYGMNTPLHIATKSCSKVEILKQLNYENFMKWACWRNILGELPLHWAARNGDLNSLKLVINSGNCNAVTRNGNSAVHEVCMHSSNSDNDLEVLRFLHEELHCNTHTPNCEGQTALHISCRRGSLKLVEYLLDIDELDPNVKDNTGSTPLMLTPLDQYEVVRMLIQYGAETSSLYSVYETFFKNYSSKNPPPTPLNVIVVGRHSSGKSTLIEALKCEDNIDIVQAEPFTAGIIPSFYQSQSFGTVMWYDLAGQSEYYASHEAVLNTVMSSSLPLVLLLVDIRNLQEIINQDILYWLHFLHGLVEPKQLSSKPHIAVVFSFKDELEGCAQEKLDFTRETLTPFFSKSIFEFVSFNALDCRKPCSNEIKHLRSQIEKSYSLLCDKTQLNFLLHCFYAFLLGNFKNEAAVTIHRVLELTEEWIETGIDPYFEQENEDNSDESLENFDPEFEPNFEEECPARLLPKDHRHIFLMCERLHSKGHVMVIKDSLKTADNSWIVINKDILLREVNGSLFAPEKFKQHYKNISTSTGVVTLTKLSEMFCKYNSVMLSGFLTYLEFCNEISDEDVLQLLQPETEYCSDRYFFFPGLVSIDKPEYIWSDSKVSFNKCGWVLHTTESNSFFTPRFIQVLLLRLAFSYPLSSKNKTTGLPSITITRQCSVWKNGLFWQTELGLDCLIEVTEHSQSIILMLRSTDKVLSDRYLMLLVQYRSSLITKILATVNELCSSLSLEECFLHPDYVKYPSTKCEDTALYSIRSIAKSVCERLPYVTSTFLEYDKVKLTDLLNFEPFIFCDNYRLFNKSFHDKDVSHEDFQQFTKSISAASPTLYALYCQLRDIKKTTYGDLRKLLGEYSIFGERDPQVNDVRG